MTAETKPFGEAAYALGRKIVDVLDRWADLHPNSPAFRSVKVAIGRNDHDITGVGGYPDMLKEIDEEFDVQHDLAVLSCEVVESLPFTALPVEIEFDVEDVRTMSRKDQVDVSGVRFAGIAISMSHSANSTELAFTEAMAKRLVPFETLDGMLDGSDRTTLREFVVVRPMAGYSSRVRIDDPRMSTVFACDRTEAALKAVLAAKGRHALSELLESRKLEGAGDVLVFDPGDTPLASDLLRHFVTEPDPEIYRSF